MTASRFVRETSYIETYLKKGYVKPEMQIEVVNRSLHIVEHLQYKKFWCNCWLLLHNVSHKEINKMNLSEKLTYIYLFGDDTC